MSRQPTNSFSRRRFLELSGAALATGSLSVNALASSANLPRKAIGMPMPRVNLPSEAPPAPREGSIGVAVMGLGGYALGRIIPALSKAERCHLSAVVTGNPEKGARVATAYGLSPDAIYSYEDFEKIAHDDRVDVVYVALPSGLHADWTEHAFKAGKHVLCEKPMALSSMECQRMISASEQADRKLMIAYRCHFEPYNLKAMELMQNEAVGAIESIRTFQTYRMGPTSPSENWRVVRSLAGGGPLEDYGIYGLQSALYLSGESPSKIEAVTTQPENDPRFAEIFSTVRTQMEFPSGAQAELLTSYDTAPGRNAVEVIGEDGTLLMEPATGYGGHTMTLTRGGDFGGVEVFTPGDPDVQFQRQCDHFAEAIQDGTRIITPGEMGLRDVQLMEAIYASAAA